MVTRIILDPAASGSWNMAVDEACLELIANREACTREDAQDSSRAVLRIYRWTPATLSLGYFQPWQQRELHSASQPCPLVRRSSGGGAILHHHELTYSFVRSASDHLRSDVQHQLYDAFHQTIIEALRKQGLLAELAAAAPHDPPPFLCFQRRAAGDVLCKGIKIVGSAQRRRQGAILQHGSILIRTSRFAPELPGIEELLEGSLDQQALLQHWIGALAQRLNWQVAEGRWSSSLLDRAADIEATRYASADWTQRR